MSRLTAMKELSEFDNPRLAASTGIDLVTIHMVEHGLIPAHYDTVDTLCQAMDVSLSEMYPMLAELFADVEALENESQVQKLFLQPANHMALRSAGIDPDVRDWIMVVDLRSASERRYRVSSIEMERIKASLMSMTDASGYLCFYADCQQVIIKKRAISEISFLVAASYAPFNSRERAFSAAMLYEHSSKPEIVALAPDTSNVGNKVSPFANLLSIAIAGQDLPPFIQVEPEDDETRFVSLYGLEVLEIPMGILFPQIYNSKTDARYVAADTKLGAMDAQGSA